MRIDVKKFLFVGSQVEKERFFEKAQEAGIVDFIHEGTHLAKQTPESVRRINQAIKILLGLPTVEQEENVDLFDSRKTIEDLLQLNLESEKALESLRLLQLEISRIHMYGDFDKTDLDYIQKEAKRSIQFFYAKADLFDGQEPPEGLLFIGSDFGMDYYTAINSKPMNYEKMIEIKIERPLGELKKEEKETLHRLKEIEIKLKSYAKYNDLLHQVLIQELNFYHLNTTHTHTRQVLEDQVFAIEGWVPENKMDVLDRLVDSMHIHCEEIQIESTDTTPTYLENQGLNRVGEDLVNIYDTPSAKDKDPSSWVLACFVLFFAFIIGDAGYGLVYLGIALFLRYRYPTLIGMKKRLLNLLTLLSVGCVVWGILITSFFGMNLAPDNPLRNASMVGWLVEKRADYVLQRHDSIYQELIQKHPDLEPIKNPKEFVSFMPEGQNGPVVLNQFSDAIMFELALFVGVVHLISSCLRYAKRNWHHLGWVLFLIGAYLYFPYYLEVPSLLNYAVGIDLIKGGKAGLELMIGGMGFAWIGSIIINGWTGVFEIMTVIQIFSDTLSYLRLYALGLAGAIVAATINEMLGSVNLVAGVLLVLLSHAVNIVLATMSGVIHGLRLNFLEWYHYSFEGGGKRFSPLKLLKKE